MCTVYELKCWQATWKWEHKQALSYKWDVWRGTMFSVSLCLFFHGFLLCQKTQGANMPVWVYVFVGSKAAIWSHKSPLKAPTQCPAYRSQETGRAFPNNCRHLRKSSGVPLNLHARLSANNRLLNSEHIICDVYSNTRHLARSGLLCCAFGLFPPLQLEAEKCNLLRK